jgi:hypothetical protein
VDPVLQMLPVRGSMYIHSSTQSSSPRRDRPVAGWLPVDDRPARNGLRAVPTPGPGAAQRAEMRQMRWGDATIGESTAPVPGITRGPARIH